MKTIIPTIVCTTMILVGVFIFSLTILNLATPKRTTIEIKEIEPLYHLNDKIIVTKGFYQNSTGTLADCTIHRDKVSYMVVLEKRNGEDFLTKDRGIVSIINVDENQIKLLEK